MLQRFKEHIEQNFPYLKKKRILVAISGGIDSVVLVNLFNTLNYAITLAHCNFKLRGNESEKDELFVKDISRKLNIKLFTKDFETSLIASQKKESIQLTARALRYDWFKTVLSQENIEYIATGHHADDNIETFLINLSRGTGLEGLSGIPAVNQNTIRPLLIFSRNEIKQYATEQKIEWREDQSNLDEKYLRNKIRHQIVPILKEINPSFIKSSIKTIAHLNDANTIINSQIDKTRLNIISKKDNIIILDIEKLLALPNPKVYLYGLLKKYKITEWEDAFNLLNAQSGKKIITSTHTILKDRNKLLIKKKEEQIPNNKEFYLINEFDTEIHEPINLKIENTENLSVSLKNKIQINKNLVSFPLILRKRKEGDVFYPIKMDGKKKLSKYFKDLKISSFEKDNVWLLCSNEKIIWVIGMRQDRRFLAKSNNTLNISII